MTLTTAAKISAVYMISVVSIGLINAVWTLDRQTDALGPNFAGIELSSTGH